MGKRQKEAADKVNKPKEESPIEIVFSREQPVAFPKTVGQSNVKTFMGEAVGPAPRPRFVKLTDGQYQYYHSLTYKQKQVLPTRRDPALPAAIDRHMAAFK